MLTIKPMLASRMSEFMSSLSMTGDSSTSAGTLLRTSLEELTIWKNMASMERLTGA